MKIKIAIALAAAGLLLALAWILREEKGSGSPEPEPPQAARADAPVREAGAVAIAAPEEASGRESIATGDESPARGAQPSRSAASRASSGPSESKLHGRVIDAEGRPVAGLGIFVGQRGSDTARGIRVRSSLHFVNIGSAVVSQEPRKVAESGEHGRFEIPRFPDGSVLHARGDLHVPVLAFDPWGFDPGHVEPVLVVAAPSAVAGVVVDEAGRPLEDVEIAVRIPESLKSSLGLILDRAVPLESFTRSGPDGHFEIADAPGVEGRHLVATREGSPSQGQPIAAGPQRQLRIVFQLEQEFHAAARGTVLDAEGAPAPGASVRLGAQVVRTEVDGRFVVDATVAEPGNEILAAKPGFAPGRATFDPAVQEYVLRLGPPALRIAGRVVDPSGRPMPSVEVRALGLTRVGGVALEDLATSDGPGPFTQDDTDAEGKFDIGGLEERTYVLGLLDRRTMRAMKSDPIQAGRLDAEIRFRSDERTGRIAGRVVDRAGAPVPDAVIQLLRRVAREEGGHEEGVEVSARADGAGEFEFPEVALDVRAARVGFPGEISFEHPLEAGQDLGRLVLVAYRRAHFQIDLAGSDVGADACELLDGSGRGQPIVKYEGNVAMSMMRWPIQGERSDALTALDVAETVVLYRGGAEVGRVSVLLVPGELTTVRP